MGQHQRRIIRWTIILRWATLDGSSVRPSSTGETNRPNRPSEWGHLQIFLSYISITYPTSHQYNCSESNNDLSPDWLPCSKRRPALGCPSLHIWRSPASQFQPICLEVLRGKKVELKNNLLFVFLRTSTEFQLRFSVLQSVFRSTILHRLLLCFLPTFIREFYLVNFRDDKTS